MTVQKLEATMTGEEFIHWASFIKLKREETEKTELYLAQIAYMLSADKDRKFKDFIFDFKAQNQEAVKLSEEELFNMLKGAF